ncbi:MAG TPA: TrkH family potassium uptake protein [Thermoplasmata archaeon]|nr:TrkH family potassium uptake protein [Thermoplasmata archaeon]
MRKKKEKKKGTSIGQEFEFIRYLEALDKHLNTIIRSPLKKVQDTVFPKILYLAKIEKDERPIYDMAYSIYKRIAHYMGIFLLIAGFPMLVPFAVAVRYEHYDHAISFFLPALGSIIVGEVSIRIFKRTAIDTSEAMLIAALGWLLLAAVGSLPFIIAYYYPGAGFGLPPLDAFFESMSGYTATGLTMIDDVERWPNSFLLWRSITQWIGGVGVIVLFLSVMTHQAGTVAHKLYSAEGRTDKMAPSVVRTTQRIWGIYALYTIVGIGLLFLAGMPFFDALNHSMTALATGGFSVKNESIMSYHNLTYELIIIFLMILGGVPFILHYHLLQGHFKKFFSNIEIKTMFIVGSIAIILMTLTARDLSQMRYTSFQAISALTGTGFSTADVSSLGGFSKFVLTILMVFGGGYGSTSSALKLIRISIIFYAVWWQLKKITAPRTAVIPFRLGGTVYKPKEVMNAALYGVFYIFILILGALTFMAHGHSVGDSLFEVASSLGNVGLSVGLTSDTMSPDLKIILILEMWIGRLEIIPVLMLILSPIKKLPVTIKKKVNLG